jgi:lycopene cyclase domain-containing protein
MGNFSYIAVLVGCLMGSGWLEIVLRTRVYRRWKRLTLAILPVLIIFTLWDIYAISQGHWTFDPRYVTGIIAVANVPLEEILFFISIPICAVLTLEGVRATKPHWIVGDEKEIINQTSDQVKSN